MALHHLMLGDVFLKEGNKIKAYGEVIARIPAYMYKLLDRALLHRR